MNTIRAVVVDPDHPGRLVIEHVPAPQAEPSQALVRVEATSLNRGEVELAMQANTGWRPGRDLAGTVIEQAADGTGPKTGTRVVGMRDQPGVWAERVAVPTDSLAELPDAVSFAQAATLPVAGLTALHALAKGGFLLTKRVLITGSTGGVGMFALQLAKLSGAHVIGTVRQSAHAVRVREAGADEVVVGTDLSPARAYGPYDLIVESLGGEAFAAAATLLAPEGTCVNIGWSAGPHALVDVMAFNRIGGASTYGLRLDIELRGKDKTPDLARLAHLVAANRLRAPIEIEASWREIGPIADGLLQRHYKGKAVLHLDDFSIN